MAATTPHSDWTFDDRPFLVRALVRIPIAAEQINLVQPILAAIAGYYLTFADTRHVALAGLLFAARALLSRAGQALARARQKPSPDRAADMLSLVFLVVGIGWHIHLHLPFRGAWSAEVSTNVALLSALILLNAWLLWSAKAAYRVGFAAAGAAGSAKAPAPASAP